MEKLKLNWVEIEAMDLKPGDICRPFISEFDTFNDSPKRTSKQLLIVDGPFECDGAFKDIFISFKTQGSRPDDDELLIHSDEIVLVLEK